MADIQAAEDLKKVGPEVNADDQDAVTTTVDTDTDAADAKEGESENGHKKRPGGWQRKIARLEAERETLIEALRKVGGNVEPKTQTARSEDGPPVKPAKPKISDFEDYAAYDAAVGKWEDERDEYYEKKLQYELRQNLTKVEAEKQQRNERQTIADAFSAQVEAARKVHKDFDSVVFNEDVPMSKAMHDAIVTSEHGALIAYELGQNPDEAERIAKLNPVAAIREIGKIESRIADKNRATEKDDEEDEEPVVTTRAPKPPATLKRQNSVSADPEDKDDYATWLRKREAQLRRK